MSGPRVSCNELSPDGYLCTESRGHKGAHVAVGILATEGEYDRWPNAVERADIPAETYWTDRTAALAEALHAQKYGPIRQVNGQQAGASHFERDWERTAKDALLYLREHGWTLEREETA